MLFRIPANTIGLSTNCGQLKASSSVRVPLRVCHGRKDLQSTYTEYLNNPIAHRAVLMGDYLRTDTYSQKGRSSIIPSQNSSCIYFSNTTSHNEYCHHLQLLVH